MVISRFHKAGGGGESGRRTREAFFSAFRWLCQGKWAKRGGLPLHRLVGFEPRAFEESVESLFQYDRIEPGSSLSWAFIVKYLEAGGAPAKELANAARAWRDACP